MLTLLVILVAAILFVLLVAVAPGLIVKMIELVYFAVACMVLLAAAAFLLIVAAGWSIADWAVVIGFMTAVYGAWRLWNAYIAWQVRYDDRKRKAK